MMADRASSLQRIGVAELPQIRAARGESRLPCAPGRERLAHSLGWPSPFSPRRLRQTRSVSRVDWVAGRLAARVDHAQPGERCAAGRAVGERAAIV